MASQLAVDSAVFPRYSSRAESRAPQAPSFALVRTSLAAALLTAPLAFGAVQPWAWGALAATAFLLLFAWSIASVRQGCLKILWSPLYVPAGFIFILGTIQFAGHFTMDSIGTREALLKLSTDLILFFLAGQFFCESDSTFGPVLKCPGRGGAGRVAETESDILSAPALRWGLVIYTFLLSLFAIFQFFSSGGLIYWAVRSPGWTFGPYVNHNHYAGLMEMLIPLSVAGALPMLRHRRSAAVVGCLILIPVASLLLSGSRGGFISLLAEAFVAAVLVFWFGPRRARGLTGVVGGAAVIAAALLFLWMAPRHIAERLGRIGSGTHPSDVEMGNRLVAARDSLGILRDHPWLGVGLGSFAEAFPRYQSFPSEFLWDHAHNDYAEALAETGFTGGGCILAAMGLFFWLAFRNLKAKLRHSAGRMQFAAALGCCGVLVHSFADFNLHIPANAAWFAVCAAIATASMDIKSNVRSLGPTRNRQQPKTGP
ncbi:MAG: O-antigen ligase family protein [Terriglobia bacterium]